MTGDDIVCSLWRHKEVPIRDYQHIASVSEQQVGNPFNIYQYSILHKVIAQVSGLSPGELVFDLFDCHLYERHIPTMLEQLSYEDMEPATVTINPALTSFYDFVEEDVVVENYTIDRTYKYEVAI